jgi:hypothetical protein
LAGDRAVIGDRWTEAENISKLSDRMGGRMAARIDRDRAAGKGGADVGS